MLKCPACGSDNLFIDYGDREPYDLTELPQKDNEFISEIYCLDCNYDFTADEVEEIEEKRKEFLR